MINKIKIILLLVLLQFSAQAQQRYQLDTKKSRILWKVETVGRHNGYLLFNKGTLDYSPKGEPSTGDFTMDMKSIRSTDRPTAAGRQEIDKELTTTGFFDTGVYPTATMSVTGIMPSSQPSVFRVSGDLTIKGITKPIEFNATINKKGDIIGVKANLSIDRTKWNIDLQEKPKQWDFLAAVKDKMIADDIMITLDLAFHK
ncbi:YceI family protein [Mucilaginibacter aquariorum]|uniref:YceI family protein n=1 Tax=Mucilaginibacter aquariorum TaxID=2967225 RepID=A0ABT1T2S2_9SPHI|nr:YceI family protein [Mucilaginibacter aquariorum]MCQ6958581.1 YceI family protein [Mucilaginibacter aquariorum]